MTAGQPFSGGRALFIGGVLAAVVVILDQLSKWVVLAHVMQPPRLIEVTGFFNLVLAWNRGISFGMFGGGALPAWALSLVALAIVAGMGVWLWRAGRGLVVLGIGMIVGGAVGNVIDRFRFGAVADFLDFHVMGYHWPAFNVADMGITVGAAILVLDSLFAAPDRPTNGPVERESAANGTNE